MLVRSLAARIRTVWSHNGRLAGRRYRIFAALAALALAGGTAAAAPALAAPGPATHARAAWHSQSVPRGLADLHLSAISCAKDGKHCATDGIFCPPGGCGGLIPGGILTTTNGGATWKKRSVPANVGDLQGIACGSAKFCVVPVTKGPLGPHISGAFLVTKNGGGSWKVVVAPGGTDVQAVSCPGPTTCYGTTYHDSNGVIDKTTNGGSHWTSKTAPAADLTAIFCWSTSHCIVLAEGGAEVMYTTNGGSSWHVVAAPGSPRLSAISCGTQSACFADGTNSAGTVFVVLATTNGGSSWKTQSVPSGMDDIGGIACASAKRCVLAATSTAGRVIIATTNGGSKWAKQTVPSGSGSLTDVSCSAKSYCIAVGSAHKESKGIVTSISPYIMAN
jgi:photosystem II stability/assembly factor-like uncharacterized protein